jgi:small-conductance mechanosensitive channel
MSNTIQKIVVEPLKEFYKNIIDFLPNLLTAILVFILGIIIARILKKVFLKIFTAINLDKLSERFGLVELLRKGGISETTPLLFSRIIGWLIIFTFLIISLRALNVPTIEKLLESFYLYLPHVFIAIFILLIGYLLSNFLGRAALIASVNAGLKISGFIGKFVKFTVFFLSVTMALEQLGIGRETVLIAFAIIYGGVVLALAIAFGTGGRDAAREYIEKRLKGEENEEKDTIQHL